MRGDLRHVKRAGFTLLELLVAITILVVAFAIIFNTFMSTTNAWKQGGDMIDGLRHGDFVMEQLVSALRSAAYFETGVPEKYGFRMKTGQFGRYPGDRISWVTSGTAFMPPNSPLSDGLHRIVVTIDNNDAGDPGVAIRAFPHLSEDEDNDGDPWFVSGVVKGLKCRTYNVEDEIWEHEWEDTNSIPSLVEITLYMDPVKEYDDPVEMKRLIEIPVAPTVTGAVSSVDGPDGSGGGGPPS